MKRIALFVAALVLTEVGLHGAAALSDRVDGLTGKVGFTPPQLDDPRLGHRGNPAHPDHDARGFRNDSAVVRARVVVLGDSHSYGTSVERDQAWPALLAAEGDRVYNMAFPGYGPLHYAELLPTALSLEPEVVVVAVYFGNDFFENFVFAQRNGALATLADSAARAEMERLEREASIAAEVGHLYRGGAPPPAGQEVERGVGAGARDLLSDRSRLYGVLRAVRRELAGGRGEGLLAADFDRAAASVTAAQAPYVSAFEGSGWRTLLTAPYRLRVLDPADARIRFGIGVTPGALAEMAAATEAAGSRFVVLLLPTKEAVFMPRVPDPGRHPGLAPLDVAERAAREELVTALAEAGIETLDLLPPLRQAAVQPYFENGDGHPNAAGHAGVAGAVRALLAARRPPSEPSP